MGRIEEKQHKADLREKSLACCLISRAAA